MIFPHLDIYNKDRFLCYFSDVSSCQGGVINSILIIVLVSLQYCITVYQPLVLDIQLFYIIYRYIVTADLQCYCGYCVVRSIHSNPGYIVAVVTYLTTYSLSEATPFPNHINATMHYNYILHMPYWLLVYYMVELCAAL